jgi:hypothetical protein
MAGGPSFPESAVAVLREARLDRSAEPQFEPVSGSLVWPDERFPEFASVCRRKGYLDFWMPWAYRASLMLDEPDAELAHTWQELKRRCPKWPGFRRARRVKSLIPTLDRFLVES